VPAATTPDNENKRLLALYELEVLDTPQEERFDVVTKMAADIFDIEFAAVVFIDKERQWVKSSSGYGQWQSPRTESICAHTILRDDITVINDISENVDVNDLPSQHDLMFYAGIPLKSPDGYNIASLYIADTCARAFSDRESRILRQLALMVETTLLNQQAMHKNLISTQLELTSVSQALHDNEKLSLLRNHNLEMVAKKKPLQSVLLSIVEGVEQQFPEMVCSILLLDHATKKFSGGVAPSLPDYYNEAIKTIIIGDAVGSCGTAAHTKERVIVENIPTHPFWHDYKALAQQADLAACWSQPILNSNSKVLGTFAIYHRTPNSPNALEIRLIEQSAYLASIAIEQDYAQRLIWRQANHDHLTGLANRQLFGELVNNAIKGAKRKEQKFSILFLDLDRFKQVNDTLGHVVGDGLLVECAQRLQNCVRESDSVARFGGDEFVMLLNDVSGYQCMERIANAILIALAKPFMIGGNRINISTSIGITEYPSDGIHYDVLLNNADQAMYQAKDNGRNQYQHFINR